MCICAIATIAASNARARDYFVNPSGANGAFSTVQGAVDAIAGQTEIDHANIFLAPARYVERVTVDKPFVTFIGQGNTPADVNISSNGTPTFEPQYSTNATISIYGAAFMARNLTFENSTADRNATAALAIECYADRAIFDSVRFLGYQDTLLVDGMSRQYFRASFITGDSDFIYGSATAVFDRCVIESTDSGFITAADTARITANGLVFLDCNLVKGADRNASDDGTSAPNNSVFLGRPWFWFQADKMPSVTYIRTRMGTHIARAGWDPWDYTGFPYVDPSLDRDPRTRVSEWGSMDLAGQLLADSNQDGTPDGRVAWADQMTAAQAANYTTQNIFGPVEFWNAATQPETSGIPYASQGDPWDPATQLLSLPAKPGAQPQLLNISTRLHADTNNNVGIAGFIITGVGPKKVILRAIGPSLKLSGVLADPVLILHGANGDLIAANDNWKDDAASAGELQSIGMAPADDREAALVSYLPPGQYTAIIGGKQGSSGTALLEVYDDDLTADSELANISTRGFVRTGDDVMIGGFTIGNSSVPTRVLVRALGSSLGDNGVTGQLADPTLELHEADGTVIVNDDWRTLANAGEIPPALQPKDDRESALLLTLPPGQHTAIVRGKNNTTGVGLVEVYNLR